MDNLENASLPQAELSELRCQCESLRQLMSSLLVLLLVISGTLNLYFWRQFKVTKGILDAERPQIEQMAAEFSKGQGIAISNFFGRLGEFEKKNPDFSPILAKYGIPVAAAAGAQPVTGPVPTQPKK